MSKTITKFAAGGSAAILALSIAGAAFAGDKAAGSRGTTLAINGQGKVVINHAEITAVSAPVLTVKIWGSSWTVNTVADTKVVRSRGGASNLGEFSVGDFVMVRGAIVDGQLAVNATHLKNESTREAAVRGEIASVTAPDTFTLTTAKGDTLTVKTTAGTKITLGNAAKSFADLSVGMTVNVKGVFDRTLKTVTAERVMIKR